MTAATHFEETSQAREILRIARDAKASQIDKPFEAYRRDWLTCIGR